MFRPRASALRKAATSGPYASESRTCSACSGVSPDRSISRVPARGLRGAGDGEVLGREGRDALGGAHLVGEDGVRGDVRADVAEHDGQYVFGRARPDGAV